MGVLDSDGRGGRVEHTVVGVCQALLLRIKVASAFGHVSSSLSSQRTPCCKTATSTAPRKNPGSMYARQEPHTLHSASSAFSIASKSSSCLTPSSSRFLSPNVCDEAVKKMQTTVAILEENPHKFKIMPLKQVPADRRRDFSNSPSLNFERPFVGWRQEPPTMYQLAPSKSASAYSVASLGGGPSSQVRQILSLSRF